MNTVILDDVMLCGGILLTRKLPSSQETLLSSRYIHACIRTYVHIYIHTYIYETLSTETRIFCFFFVTGTCRRSLERRSPAVTGPFAGLKASASQGSVTPGSCHASVFPCRSGSRGAADSPFCLTGTSSLPCAQSITRRHTPTRTC